MPQNTAQIITDISLFLIYIWILFLSYFCAGVLTTYSRFLLLFRSTEYLSDQMILTQSFLIQSLYFWAHTNRAATTILVRNGRFLATYLAMLYVWQSRRIVRSKTETAIY